MVDLLETAPYPYIRISSSGKCHLNIAHKMLGTQPLQRRNRTDMALRVGSALEPVMIQWMAEQGLSMNFVGHGTGQLRLAAFDPYREGHPDGLGWVGQASDCTQWFRREVPKVAQDRLFAGELMMLEFKTMKADSWDVFIKKGLEGGAFLTEYIDQIQSYLNILADPGHDEAWVNDEVDTNGDAIGYGSSVFRQFIRDGGWQRPTACLVIGLNTDTKRYGFQILEVDTAHFKRLSDTLSLIPEALHRGELPAPTLDGKSGQCWWCDFAHLCPKVQELRQAAVDDLDMLPTASVDALSLAELNELSNRYTELTETASAIDSEKKALRERISELLREVGQPSGKGGKSLRGRTDDFYISSSPVAGRKSIDLETLKVLAEDYGFTIPYKEGEGYNRMRIERVYGPSFKAD